MDEKKPPPQWRKWLMKALISLLVAGSLMGGCSYINKKVGLSDDHILEEMLEHQIEEQTGLDIDLSHETPE